MLCERCHKREANVHLTEVVNNHKTEMNVCEYCAQELQQEAWGFDQQLNFNLHNLLGGMIGCQFTPSMQKQKKNICSNCGINEEQFAQGGLLGCARCYEEFREQIIPLVRRIHGTEMHRGKVPERSGGIAKINKAIRDLKAQLQLAIAHEEFEKAAQLRDKVKILEQKKQ